MRILFLTEGRADEQRAFSGTAYSVYTELRRRGHEVIPGDVELYGPARILAAALSFGMPKERWVARFHLGPAGFALRSRHARRLVCETPNVDLVLQIGATFEAPATGPPIALLCDSNIRMAERGRETGQSAAAWLSPRAMAAIVARETRVYRNATAVTTLSDRVRRSFIEDFWLPPARVTTVRAGPNFDASAIVRSPKEAHAAPVILFVGRQFERKGGDLLLRAFAMVRERIPEARLLIVGPDPLLSAPPGVEFLGFLRKGVPAEAARLAEAYARARVYCLPTRYEPFGISFLEAMHYELPCVGPDAWAVPEMIVDGVTGWTVPPEDVIALSDRLCLLLSDADLARRMGEAGRQRAEAEFTWSASGARLVAALERAVARPGGPPMHEEA